MQKKKSLTTLIIAILTFSIITAFIPIAMGAVAEPTLSKDTGNVGDEITVSGTITTAFGKVEIYWDAIKPWDGVKGFLAEDWANVIMGYAINITIPEVVNGTHYVIAYDFSTEESNHTAFYLGPKIVPSRTSGLPGDTIEVSGTGFAATSNVTLWFQNSTTPPIWYEDITPEAGITTTTLGSFAPVTFTVPTVDYGTYKINATDEEGNTAWADFNVTAYITLTPEEGPTGTVVTVKGYGFTTGETANITFAYGNPNATLVNTTLPIGDDETFEGTFIVPTVPVYTYDVFANDTASPSVNATASFEVTGTTWIGLTPAAGRPGWEVTIEGVNFTAIADTEVTVKFEALTVKTFYTNTTGGFKGTFDVPSLDTGTYIVKATDANDLYATKNFTIAITLIILDPTKGPTGTNVTISGYGFTKGGTANVTIGTILVKTGILVDVTTGRFTDSFIVPTLPVDTYTVTAEDSESLTASTSFQVTKTTDLILTPPSAPVGYEVSIEGKYFTAKAGISVTVWFYNTTWCNATSLSFSTYSDGVFNGTFIVPDVALGGYTINATDANDLYAETSFNVVEVYVEMYTRSLEYLQGDTISFYIKCTFNYNMTITIEDPTEYPAATVSILAADWETMDDWKVVPYEHTTFTLPSDAVLGTWNWTATIGTETTETDIFTVVERPTLSMILDGINELEVKIDGLVTKADDIYVLIGTAKGEVLLKLDELEPILVDIKNRVIVINTTLGEVRTLMEALNLTAINAVITSLNQTIATISSDIGTVTVSINDIGLKVVAINGTVATIKTDLGTMQGTVTSIDDDVATIKTDVGTVKADVSDIVETGVTVDMTPVWIAVVFSILAFIVTIATAYMLRSKLA